MVSVQSREVGRCIYCLTTDGELSEEHVIPLGLGGRYILGHASCRKCAKETSRIEGSVQRQWLLQTRASLGLPTRHPKNRPRSFSMRVCRRGSEGETVLELPAEEMVGIVPFLLLRPPAALTGAPYTSGVDAIGTKLVRIGGKDLATFIEQHNLKSMSQSTTFSGNDFERMLCKIGYGLAILVFGLERVESCLARTIVGDVNDAGRWVGCMEIEPPPATGNLHEAAIAEQDGMILAHIRLFAAWGAPQYTVVVGRMR